MVDMRIDDSTVSPTRDEDRGMILTSSSEATLNKSSVQPLGCGDNCLNGIKRPPEHRTKTTGKGGKEEFIFNGLTHNPSLVTHGGRTHKKPARYIESDSDDEQSSRRKFHSVKRKRLLSDSSRPKCKNGRTKSIERESSLLLPNHGMEERLMSPKRQNGERTDLEYGIAGLVSSSAGIVSSLSSTCINSRSQSSESVCMKRTPSDLQTENESSNSSETPSKRRRGRPPKNLTQSFEKLHSVDIRSPHGNCDTSATKASLASPSTSKFCKKRKLSKGIRNLPKGCLSSSSDENESATATPRRRGRPPKKLLSSCETKHKIFRTQNGVKKPWVRPLLKAVDKRSLLKPSKESLNYLLHSPEAFMTKVNSKFVGVNGCRVLSPGKEMKRKRGRPPKSKPEPSFDSDKIESDAFHFTGEDEQNDGSPTLKRKLKKLKLQRKEDKRPLGASALKKRAIAEKLKRKALNKARKNLKVRSELKVSQSDCEPVMGTEQSSDNVHKRRRRNKADKILGMRRNVSGMYDYLVQWKDGTSSWAPSNELADYEPDFKCFLGHEYQDVTVVNRLSYHAYWKDDLIECHGNQSEIDRLLSNDDSHLVQVNLKNTNCAPVDTPDPCEKHFICKEVSVQKLDDCLHVTVGRSTSKRRKINERIVDSLTLVMEDAATDQSEFVVISGLGEETFCGVDLKDLTTVSCEEEPKHYRRDVDKIRYVTKLAQRKCVGNSFLKNCKTCTFDNATCNSKNVTK